MTYVVSGAIEVALGVESQAADREVDGYSLDVDQGEEFGAF